MAGRRRGEAKQWPKAPTRANALGSLVRLCAFLPLGEVARRLGMSGGELVARIDAFDVECNDTLTH